MLFNKKIMNNMKKFKKQPSRTSIIWIYYLLHCKENVSQANDNNLFTNCSNDIKKCNSNSFSDILNLRLFNPSLNAFYNKTINVAFKLIKMYYVILLQFSFVMANNYGTKGSSSSSFNDLSQKASKTLKEAGSIAKGYGNQALFFLQMFFMCIIFDRSSEECANRYIIFPMVFFFCVILCSIIYSMLSRYFRRRRAAKKQKKKERSEQSGEQLLQISQESYLSEMNDVNHMQSQTFQEQLQQSQEEEQSENSSNSELTYWNSESLHLGYNTVPD
ncbi:VIR protein [Plasmodium vivax]|uniref:VIR protein n=1 Tax=Plasmodium vivax TaxID=5855 RepID=A0A1G4GWZ1_PLAVI|nr:VIR protein [Plasmodium vivax]